MGSRAGGWRVRSLQELLTGFIACNRQPAGSPKTPRGGRGQGGGPTSSQGQLALSAPPMRGQDTGSRSKGGTESALCRHKDSLRDKDPAGDQLQTWGLAYMPGVRGSARVSQRPGFPQGQSASGCSGSSPGLTAALATGSWGHGVVGQGRWALLGPLHGGVWSVAQSTAWPTQRQVLEAVWGPWCCHRAPGAPRRTWHQHFSGVREVRVWRRDRLQARSLCCEWVQPHVAMCTCVHVPAWVCSPGCVCAPHRGPTWGGPPISPIQALGPETPALPWTWRHTDGPVISQNPHPASCCSR